jgi:LacI family transcriptional regulator
MASPPTRATTKSMARAAGVSVATVSRALNGSPLVDPATRERVLAVAQQLDYKPNRQARSLSLGRSRMLGLATPRLGGDFFGNLVAGFARMAARHGHDVVLLVPGDLDAVQRVVHERTVDGIAFLFGGQDDPDLTGLRGLSIPHVLVNKDAADIPWVRTHFAAGVRDALLQRCDAGYHRCRFVGAGQGNSTTAHLLDGFHQALRRQPAWESSVHGSDDEAIAAVCADWREGDLTIFARPLHFLRFYRALRKIGMMPPARSELLCFDAAPAMAYLDLRFCVIPQDVTGVGAEAARLLLQQLDIDAGASTGNPSGTGILIPSRHGAPDDEPIPP